MSENLILLETRGPVGLILLNRPKALNALNQTMIDQVIAALNGWRNDEKIAMIVIHSTSDRGLCAGGDVRAIRQMVLDGNSAEAEQFFASEYQMNLLIGTYPKPILALMDGFTMGGGVGISAHASHRLVTGRTLLAMPESAIGFFCDVGATYLLARAPSGIGNYLGLTGEPISGDDAIFARLADAKINAGDIPELIDTLENANLAIDASARLGQIIAKFIQPPQSGELQSRKAEIANLFNGATVSEIVENLQGEDTDWTTKAAETILGRSPRSLAVIFQAIKNAAAMPDLATALETELILAHNMIHNPDFAEGVRAVLVDKDRKPKWSPPTLQEITIEDVEAQFAPRQA